MTTRLPLPSFRDFIAALPNWDNPAGDFVNDAKADRNLPDARSWLDLQSYLARMGAASDVYPAARQVWNAFDELLAVHEASVSERAFAKTEAHFSADALEAAAEADLEELLYLFADAVSYADDSRDAKVRRAWKPVKVLVEKRLKAMLKR